MYKVEDQTTFRENIRKQLVDKMKPTKFPVSLLKKNGFKFGKRNL